MVMMAQMISIMVGIHKTMLIIILVVEVDLGITLVKVTQDVTLVEATTLVKISQVITLGKTKEFKVTEETSIHLTYEAKLLACSMLSVAVVVNKKRQQIM